MAKQVIAIYLCSKNDSNGNPCRGWFFLSVDKEGHQRGLGFVDEGYAGWRAVKEDSDFAAYAEQARGAIGFDITKKEYLHLVRDFGPKKQNRLDAMADFRKEVKL